MLMLMLMLCCMCCTQVALRSASRDGLPDGGRNERRLEALRRALRWQQVQALPLGTGAVGSEFGSTHTRHVGAVDCIHTGELDR